MSSPHITICVRHPSIPGWEASKKMRRPFGLLIHFTQYRKDGTRIDAYVEVAEDASLTFPLFGFPGYEAKLNGERMNWRLGENNRLTVDLPSGSMGVLEIHYAGKTIWKVMDILSVCAALTLGGWVWHRKKRELA